jgi:tetratricopeptide (TPR) repeat protein
MVKRPPNLYKFWNELKRRKVVRAVFVYVAAAWAIMEASDTIFPRLGLPDWTVTFVLILLIIFFVLIVVLTWIYDITPEGIKMTRDLEDELEEEKTRAYVSEKSISVTEKQKTPAEQNVLQQRIKDLEKELTEARKTSFRTMGLLFLKKILVPVLLVAALVILVLNREKLIQAMGFGSKEREVARIHNGNATALIVNGDYEAARREAELALESDPDYSYAWSNLAVINYREGNLNEAINQTIKAITIDPRNSRAPYNLAIALEDSKDFNQAFRWYREAIRIDSTYNADTVYVAASSALGRLYNLSGFPLNARIVLNRAKDLFPKSRYVYLIYKNLGNAFLLQNQVDSALKYLELSIVINPVEPETNLFLARAYEEDEQLAKSIEQWQKYIDLETDTAKIKPAKEHLKELAIRRLQQITR